MLTRLGQDGLVTKLNQHNIYNQLVNTNRLDRAEQYT